MHKDEGRLSGGADQIGRSPRKAPSCVHPDVSFLSPIANGSNFSASMRFAPSSRERKSDVWDRGAARPVSDFHAFHPSMPLRRSLCAMIRYAVRCGIVFLIQTLIGRGLCVTSVWNLGSRIRPQAPSSAALPSSERSRPSHFCFILPALWSYRRDSLIYRSAAHCKVVTHRLVAHLIVPNMSKSHSVGPALPTDHGPFPCLLPSSSSF